MARIAGRPLPGGFVVAISLYTIWTLAATMILALLLWRHGTTLASLRLEEALTAARTGLGLCGALLGIFLWPVAERVARSLPGPGGFRMQSSARPHPAQPSAPDVIFVAVFGGLLLPAVEELMFRGYVLRALEDWFGSTTGSVLVTAIIFASIHLAFGYGTMIYAFLMSLILSGLVLLTNSLYSAVLTHSLVNLFGFVAAPALSQRDRGPG